MTDATVIAIQLHHSDGQPLTPVASARGLVAQGLEGDSHSRRPPGHKRQVLILDRSTLDHFGFTPGDMREQITLQGMPDVTILPPGTRLRMGDVTFEAIGDCAPCLHLGAMLGVEDAELFRQALDKRRGLLCRVIDVTAEGMVRVGDPVQTLP